MSYDMDSLVDIVFKHTERPAGTLKGMVQTWWSPVAVNVGNISVDIQPFSTNKTSCFNS